MLPLSVACAICLLVVASSLGVLNTVRVSLTLECRLPLVQTFTVMRRVDWEEIRAEDEKIKRNKLKQKQLAQVRATPSITVLMVLCVAGCALPV